MRSRVPFFLLSLVLLALPTSAQVRLDGGVAAGLHAYDRPDDTLRVLAGADLLVGMPGLGGQLALDYTHLGEAGSALLLHANLAYQHEFNDRWALIAGFGPTFVQSANFGSDRSFNVALELARNMGGHEVFVRARQYDFELDGFRSAATPGATPAFSAGVRRRLR